jgi:hypothetical protein
LLFFALLALFVFNIFQPLSPSLVVSLRSFAHSRPLFSTSSVYIAKKRRVLFLQPPTSNSKLEQDLLFYPPQAGLFTPLALFVFNIFCLHCKKTPACRRQDTAYLDFYPLKLNAGMVLVP